MASSGWQNEQKVVNRSPGCYKGNVRIDLISHTGTNLRIKGSIAFCPRDGVSTYAYYNEDITVTPQGGSAKTIVPGNQRIDKDKYADFDVTIDNVAKPTTSIRFKVNFYNRSYFNKDLYWTLNFSASGDPPSNYSAENIIPEWDRITFTSIVGNNGGVALTSHCPSIQKEPLVGGRQKYENTYSTSNTTITSTVSNSSSKINNPTWEIKGCGFYYTGAYVSNGIEPNLYGQGPSTYTPPAPCILNVSSTSGGYNINFTGDTSKNNSDYDAASLTRTVRYKVDNGNWIYLENNTQRTLDYLTTSSILETYVFQIVVQGWMTYHNLDSVISEYIIEPPGKDYKAMGPGIGKFDNSAVNFDKMYIAQSSVTKKLDKLYISVRGKARRIF